MADRKKYGYLPKNKKALTPGTSGEVKATVDEIANVDTLLDSGSDCRMISAGLLRVLSEEKGL